jgi:hypothetical protein
MTVVRHCVSFLLAASSPFFFLKKNPIVNVRVDKLRCRGHGYKQESRLEVPILQGGVV